MKLVDHIMDVYGFEVVPPSIPRSGFQYLKRDFYLFIKRNISENAFYFLQSKFPVRYGSSRPDSAIWLSKKSVLEKSRFRTNFEVQIKPIPPEVAAFHQDSIRGIYKVRFRDNYRVKIFHGLAETPDITFLSDSSGQNVDIYFSDILELKEILRDYKLRQILQC
jgi:hypothetical protein